MEIGEVTWAWRFPGVVMTDVDLIGPKPSAPADGSEPPPRQHIHVDEVFARVSPLSLLFGTTQVDFAIDGFDGEMSGSFTRSDAMTKISAELSDINPGQLPGVAEALQLPLSGRLSGTVDLSLPEGKYGAAEGDIDLQIEDFTLADGKTKVRGLIALPEINAGTFTIKATATQGRIEFEQFETQGPDLVASAEGKLRLRDRLELSMAEQLTLGFKFSDVYRDKDDNTRSLLGKPGDKLGGLIDMNPQSKQAKQPDGSYRWRVTGTFGKLNFSPARAVKGADPKAPGP
jgi:type II secretion system protein N